MMKRITILLALFALTLQGMAQKYLDIYQDGVVIKSISAAEVDSISISETQPRIISFYRDGGVFVSYSSEEVDSIKVFHENDEPLVYLGIVGFNQELYEKQLDVLATSTSSQFRSFVSNLPRKDGTLLYYAVDDALDMLSQKQIDTPLSSANLVTFTDGLDQGSLMMNGNYLSDSEYLNAISNRIASTKIKGLPITAYSVGLRSSDVVDNIMFQNNLRKLSTSKDKAFEVSDMDEVRTRLQEIADQIISISTRQTFSVKIPGVSNGTLIRFTFDSKSATESQMYIEGTFNLQDRSLHEVSYHGIRSNSGSMVQGTQNGIFVTYTFTGLQREDGNGLIPTNDIRQYYRVPVSPTWQVNSEFSPANNTQRNVSHSGSAIVLALDCSNSLGAQFSNMKSYAQDFINQVAGNTMPFRVDAPQRVSASTAIVDDKLLVSVTWDKAKHAESYDVYRSSSSSGSYRKVATGVTSNSWNDESPLQGNNYYYIIANGHGLTSSAKYSDKVVLFPFAAPSNVKAALVDDNFVIKLNWDAVDFAEQYTIYRSSNSSSGFKQVAENVTNTTWTDESPMPGNNYYRVYAVGYGHISSASSTTDAVRYALDAPTGVAVELDEDNLVLNISWKAVNHAESYSVYRNGNSSGTFTLMAEDITANSWTDTAPLQGSNYYKIYAVGYGLTSPASVTTNMVKVNYTPDAPQNVSAVLDDENFNIVVSWDAVKHADSYIVYRSGSSTGTFTQVAEGIRTSTWIDRSPLEGMNYYRVVAVGHGLTSSQSNVSNGINYALDAPAKVKAVINANNGTVDVSWDAVSLAEHYTVYRSGSSTGEFAKVAENVTATSWTDTAPLADRNYYKVQASGHGLESPMSSVAMVLKPLPNDGVITVNGVQFKMIKVSGGTFQMGQSADGNNATPVHSVTLSDYYIGETEVTQELWQAVMGSNPSYFSGAKRAKCPVEEVSWNDCQTFITKLNALTGQDFRLPTEAEWEFAAKGGTQSKGYTYSGSNTVGDVAWYTSNSGSQTHDVATKAPNELGLYDMSGNVWEWCQDWYGSYSSSAQTNPTGPSSGSHRVLRGGGWLNNAEHCWTAFRGDYHPTFSYYNIGLRIAL